MITQRIGADMANFDKAKYKLGDMLVVPLDTPNKGKIIGRMLYNDNKYSYIISSPASDGLRDKYLYRQYVIAEEHLPEIFIDLAFCHSEITLSGYQNSYDFPENTSETNEDNGGLNFL